MERVLVFGATSAIAAEVCALHAARGDRLLLVGRNPDKLAALVARVGADFRVADLARLDDNAQLVADCIAALGGVDRVLVAHGELGDQLETERDVAAALAIITTNFTSVVSLLVPLANELERAQSGRIGVITSVAGDRGRPRNYTYGAAKGALNVYLQGLRTRLYAAGVAVTTLKLGPVDTPMTEGHKKHALFGRPAAVAKDIVAAMDENAAEVYVPRVWRLIMPIVRSAPEALFQKLSFLGGR
jgi:decaprenylphospho-beta-D-erythro-pentofuranosid-2-ulose 2-reductase